MKKWLKKYFDNLMLALQVGFDYLAIVTTFILGDWLWIKWTGVAADQSVGQFSLQIYLGISLLFISVLKFCGAYTQKLGLSIGAKLRTLFNSFFLSYAILLGIFFFTSPVERSPIPVFLSIPVLIISFGTMRMIIHYIYQLSYRNGLGFKNALVYGVGKTGKQLARYLNKETGFGYRVIGYIDESFPDNPIQSGVRRLPEILGCQDDIGMLTSRYEVEDMFIAMPSATVDQISQIVESCNGLLRQYHFVPQLKKVNLNRLQLGSINGIPFCAVKKYRKNYFKNFIKRLFDLIFSGGFLMLMSPIFAIIALKIKHSSDGPTIFKQERIGKNGKLFTMYKFRSMYIDTAPYAQTPQDTDDPRITPFGRFLRRTSLDELPQFLNVFLGQMSVVGPRPEMKFIVEKYNALQRERLKVKPGITGLWQISLDRTRPIHEAIEHDLYYIENQSLRLDLRIIWETFIFCVISVFKKLNF